MTLVIDIVSPSHSEREPTRRHLNILGNNDIYLYPEVSATKTEDLVSLNKPAVPNPILGTEERTIDAFCTNIVC